MRTLTTLCLGGALLAGCAHADLRSGLDTAGYDPSVRAQDDLFRHVNGTWLDKTEIPSDRSNYGTFTMLADGAEAALKDIVAELSAEGATLDADGRKIADLYASFMDEAAIEAAGLTPLEAMRAEIAKIADTDDLARLLGSLERRGVHGPLGMYVYQDEKQSDRYAVYLEQSGLGLPDRDYYAADKAEFEPQRAAYLAYLTELATLAELGEPAETAGEVMALETRLAAAQWTRVQNRDRDKTYNPRTLTELDAQAAGFAWAAYLEGAGVPPQERYLVRQPDYAASLGATLDAFPLPVWKRYLELRLLDAAAPLLPKVFVDAHFAFHGKALGGIEENRPRWKRGLAAVESALGFALAKVYVARHFKPEAKAKMSKLVDNLIVAFRGGIDSLEWMSPETKVKAKEKLAKFIPKIGYPDTWRDYSKLEIVRGDVVGNAQRADSFEHDRRLALLGGPVDRDEWFMTPQTVNAYYNPTMNEIVFPAAILQPPFFDLEADDAVNYGAIGAVIGHELSHGFDDQGRKSDGDGNLTDWWTESDAREFEARAARLASQYDGYEPLPGKKLNGKFTLGENIGDLGGLTIAFRAYQLALGGAEAPVIDGLTGPQRFFHGWAQIWRRKYREAELARRLVTDPHSPSEFRVKGVIVNMPEFHEAFGTKAGDGLWRTPEDRVKIW